jgi:hypothetical protein
MQKIRNFFQGMFTNLGVIGEFITFLWQRRVYWMIPMVVILLAFGMLIIFASASGIGPFIYALF